MTVTLALAAAPAEATTSRTALADGGGQGAVKYSSGKPRDTRLTIASLGIRRLPVIAYCGRTDDGPGTRIQNRGIAASPYGRHGGIGPAASSTIRSPRIARFMAGSPGTPRR